MSHQPNRKAEKTALEKLNKRLSSVLSRLPDIERQVLELRMGLVDGEPMKPGETADKLGLSVHEMKKIEERAFSRIREIGNLQGLEKFMEQK